MRRVKLGSESGRIWAGMGGVLLMAAGAAVLAMVAFSTDSPAGRVPVAQADHNTLTEAEIEALPNGTKIVICHTEGNGSQHTIEVASEAFLNAGHFDAPGNPLHDVEAVHDFIVSVEGMGVINDEECGAAPPVATSTAEVIATNTSVPPTNTPVPPVATSTAEVIATNTSVPPTNTPVPPVATSTAEVIATNTSVPPTNTPEATNTAAVPPTNTPEPTATEELSIVQVESVQVTPPPTQSPPLPPAAPLEVQAPQVLGVQATPPPTVQALPSTGSGGYESNSMALIIGIAMILAGTSISLMAMKRRA